MSEFGTQANDDEVVHLSSKLCQELALLSVLSPLMRSSLRAEPSDTLWCTDASEEAYGECEA